MCPAVGWIGAIVLVVGACARAPAPEANVVDKGKDASEWVLESSSSSPLERQRSLAPIATYVVPEKASNSVRIEEARAGRLLLPKGVIPGKEVRVSVPNDRSAVVVHAPAWNRQAIVYLHGVCGDVYAIRSWAEAISEIGTLVAMLGDERCKGRPGRFRWYRNPERLDRRIRRTLEAVSLARGGQLDLERVTLVGYSQGAARAELVASRFPLRYPRVLLGSPPDAPNASRYSLGHAVAVVAGALEQNAERRRGVRELQAEGVPARFIALPGAYHGQYGREGGRVMREATLWLFEQVPSEKIGAVSD